MSFLKLYFLTMSNLFSCNLLSKTCLDYIIATWSKVMLGILLWVHHLLVIKIKQKYNETTTKQQNNNDSKSLTPIWNIHSFVRMFSGHQKLSSDKICVMGEAKTFNKSSSQCKGCRSSSLNCILTFFQVHISKSFLTMSLI